MGVLRTDGPESRRRAAARDPEAAPAPGHIFPAGVSNHLLARALSTGNPPAGATLQRVFKFKGKEVPREAKVPTIHGVSAIDLQNLAKDDHDYGTITTAASVQTAMGEYRRRHTVVEAPLALDEMHKGYKTVWTDDAFTEHNELSVRATFQLDSMQGKHDGKFASEDKDARKKTGGQQMPPDSDYEALAQGVPAALTRARLDDIWAKAARQPLNFSVQKFVQDDGFQYEISAMWAPVDDGLHLLVYYHCYPPR